MKHVFVIVSIVALIATGMFLPYTHGDYDYFSVGLFYIFQFGAFTSLLLVPIGITWLIMNFVHSSSRRIAPSLGGTPGNYSRYMRKAGFVVAVIIVLATALGSFASNNRFFAIIILGIGVFILFTFREKTRTLYPVPDLIMPYYLIFIPLSVVFVRMTCLERAKDYTTDFVITQGELLIQDIEAYKKTNGHYPVSLLSTIEDYKPFVSGIPRFYYEPSGDAYNIYFEQVSTMLGTEEIVMYNKLNEQEMTVHNQDLLRIAPARILRGYHRVADHPRKHWKIFYFD